MVSYRDTNEYAQTYRFSMRCGKQLFGVCSVSEIIQKNGKWLPVKIESAIYRSKEKNSILMELFAIAEQVANAHLEDKQKTYDIEMADYARDKAVVIYTLHGCEVIEYKLSKHDATENGIMWETLIVQPKDVEAIRP